MSQYFTTSIATGQWFYTTDADPNAAITAPRGSVALRFDAGNVGAWINTNSLTDWSAFLVVTTSGVLSLLGVSQLLLTDNSATALKIGSAGALNLLAFDTTNGGEYVAYNGFFPFQINTGGLDVAAGTVSFPEGSLAVASAAADAGNNLVSAGLFLRKTLGANASGIPVNNVLAFPSRTGGWRIADAYISSSGVTGGSVTVSTVSGAVTNAMVPGNANAVTRATDVNLTNAPVASGGNVTFIVATGSPATEVFVRVEPL
jgi:hypothetical protein